MEDTYRPHVGRAHCPRCGRRPFIGVDIFDHQTRVMHDLHCAQCDLAWIEWRYPDGRAVRQWDRTAAMGTLRPISLAQRARLPAQRPG